MARLRLAAFTIYVSWTFGVSASGSNKEPAKCLQFEDIFRRRARASQLYIADMELRAQKSQAMKPAGYDWAKKAIAQHKHRVRPGSTVLEIGPFENPLGPGFGPDHPWLVWEYDSESAHKIRASFDPDTARALVFQVDLNALDSEKKWKAFWAQNERELAGHRASPKLGAVVLSSVLNYIDYPTVLRQIVPHMDDGGLLIISNTNLGTLQFFRGGPPTGPEILEHLVREFPSQIVSLKDARIEEASGWMSSFRGVIEIKHQANALKRDLYDEALNLHLDSFDMHSGPPESWWDVSPADGDRSIEAYSRLAHRFADASVDNSQWRTRRESLKEKLHGKILDAIERIRTAPAGSGEWQTLRKSFKSASAPYNVILERDILTRALEIWDLRERNSFLDRELAKLYQSLNHVVRP